MFLINLINQTTLIWQIRYSPWLLWKEWNRLDLPFLRNYRFLNRIGMPISPKIHDAFNCSRWQNWICDFSLSFDSIWYAAYLLSLFQSNRTPRFGVIRDLMARRTFCVRRIVPGPSIILYSADDPIGYGAVQVATRNHIQWLSSQRSHHHVHYS